MMHKAPTSRSAIKVSLCEDLVEKLVENMGLMRREPRQKHVLMGEALDMLKFNTTQQTF